MNQFIDLDPAIELSDGDLVLTFTGLTKEQLLKVDRHYSKFEALAQSASPAKFFNLSERVRQACLNYGVNDEFWQYSGEPQFELNSGLFDLVLRIRAADNENQV